MTDLAAAETRAPARVTYEPLTYRRDLADVSYIADRVLRGPAARARLQRHAHEMDQIRADVLTRAARASGDFEFRVNPSLVTGQGGELAPPAWLNEYFATAPRPGRVLSKLMRNFNLPPGCQSVNLPRMTVGNITQWQGNDDSATAAQDVATAATSSEVVTIAGQGDISLQLLEQSPVGAHTDEAWFTDLSEAYDNQLELQLLTGTGSNTIIAQSQLPGILNVSGINSITYTSGAPTATGIYPSLGQAAAAIGTNRKRPPEAFFMQTARWGWLTTGEDVDNRPLEVPDLNGVDNPLCPGSLLGWPVWLNDSIPRTLGAGANQDSIVLCRPSDLLLFEANPAMSTNLEVLPGTLQARLIWRNYAAAITGRYPSSIAYLNGTGLIPVSGY